MKWISWDFWKTGMLRPAFTTNTFSECSTDIYHSTNVILIWSCAVARCANRDTWFFVKCLFHTPKGCDRMCCTCQCFLLEVGPMLAMISLNSLLTCLLWRSQGMLCPSRPWVFTKRFYFIWCASGEGSNASCIFKLSASSAYFVHQAAWKWSKKIPQQQMIRSPSPSHQASVNSRAKEPRWQKTRA